MPRSIIIRQAHCADVSAASLDADDDVRQDLRALQNAYVKLHAADRRGILQKASNTWAAAGTSPAAGQNPQANNGATQYFKKIFFRLDCTSDGNDPVGRGDGETLLIVAWRLSASLEYQTHRKGVVESHLQIYESSSRHEIKI